MIQTGRDKFRKYKAIISFLIAVNALLPAGINYLLLRFFRNTNGAFGLLTRYIIVKNLAKSCGDNVSIQPNVFLFNLKNLSLGSNISIHPLCYLDAAGGISIGNNVSIAHNSSVLSTNHTWDDLSVPIKYNHETFDQVSIADDVWIGCGCRILAGVNIATRTVIAAGAVVNKNTEGYAVYAGIPAKLIKKINAT